ncbi:Crp/Fnr family transcriptional regulator [Polymorphobacter sp. PAMC 29334]|uniref:Crp/Fnr family transcriptional regulator n=1 Tax=Polymorphobacter sp. PAMC 29334 TaxID=2862331 RepID=UPI001D006600|nr:Crp/Fnr family transcriptional regulator [Polymorphobacter sp. PAMC 29334]
MALQQTSVRNTLLATMAASDFSLLEPYLQRIPLPVRMQLHVAGQKIEQVYFPEDGIISIVAITLDGDECEVGVFGREGMSETATVLGTDHSPHAAYVQSAGVSGLKLPSAVLTTAFEKSSTLRRHLLRYVQAMVIQLSSSITAAGQSIEQRLARWILMCHDRVDDDDIPLTHEFVAMMLGVRRSSVTEAMIALAGSGMIETRRGIIIVRDRRGLETTAAGGYGLAEHEYKRLIGVALRRTPVA